MRIRSNHWINRQRDMVNGVQSCELDLTVPELLNPHYLTRPVGEDSDALWEEVSHYIEQQYASRGT